jgi:hypothetical protein
MHDSPDIVHAQYGRQQRIVFDRAFEELGALIHKRALSGRKVVDDVNGKAGVKQRKDDVATNVTRAPGH